MKNKNYPGFPITEQIRITSMYSFFQREYPQGFHFPGEVHSFWECVCVLRGGICASGDDRIYHMGPGEIIFHKPLEFHKFTVTHGSGAQLLIISFSAEGPQTEALRDKVFFLSHRQQNILQELQAFVQSHAPDTSAEDVHMYLHALQHTKSYGQQMTGQLHRLFLSLTEDGLPAAVSTTPDAITFRKSIRFLHDQLHRQPSLQEIAHHCCLSQASLKRLFDKYAGVSVHKYLLKLKIRTATQMLQNRETVTHTAEALGFASQSYFSKVYKRETGLNPTDAAKLRD